MNAFGGRARHTIVSGVPDAFGARDAIANGIKYEIAQHPPPLTGKPSVARYEAIANFMRRFDLVLTYNWGAIDGVMARRVFGAGKKGGGLPPLIHHEDGFNEDEAVRLSPVRNMYRRIALGAAHALVVPSHVLERIALKDWKQPLARVHRISNGISTVRYAGRPEPKAIPGLVKQKGETVVGTVAGLRAVKDLPMLVRVAGGVTGKARLVIVGEGPERQAIEDAAEAMFFDDKLVMPGFLHDPARWIGLFDAFALTSKSEQQRIAVMEAMAAGLPIVAPMVGDIDETVAPETRALLDENRFEVHLRDRLQWIADNPDGARAIGRKNQERARALFDESTMISAYARLYGEAVGRPDALM